jgi:hypothetical protein
MYWEKVCHQLKQGDKIIINNRIIENKKLKHPKKGFSLMKKKQINISI